MLAPCGISEFLFGRKFRWGGILVPTAHPTALAMANEPLIRAPARKERMDTAARGTVGVHPLPSGPS